jgi:3-deoxy-D-manno-octulosonic-acid transferase
MISIFFLIYDWLLLPLLILIFKLLGLMNPKIRQGLEMRKKKNGVLPWLDFIPNQKPIWIHCASGEFEYAKPVIRRLKELSPDCKIMVTYFSPSFAQAVRQFPGVDFATPLPWDTPALVKEFVEFHKPKVLLIARTDAWPEMLRQTTAAEIPSLLFSATLSERSLRTRMPWTSAWVLRPLTQIFCVSEADAENFARLGLANKTQVAGDTRFDQVRLRLQNPKPLRSFLDSKDSSSLPVFVAGSTWPEDEAVLLPVIARFRSTLRWILVPHEPTDSHLRALETQLDQSGIPHQRYSQINSWQRAAVILVDQTGILAELYSRADFAFVGGSYRKTVHSVMEPLAAGCPTFVGPFYRNNREAIEFKTVPLASAADYKLYALAVARNADEFIRKLEDLKKLQQPSWKENLRQEILRRSHKTELVVEWVRAQRPDL